MNQGLVCVGLYGVSTNLVLYLIRELRQGASSAATNTSNWQGAVYFFSVIGGFVGDAYLGRYWASFLFQLLGISVSTLTYDSTHTFHYGPIVPYLTSSLLTYDSTHTFHYGPIVPYLTSKEDDKKIYLSIIFLSFFLSLLLWIFYYVFNVHYVFSPVIYTLNFVKKIVHIPL